MASSVSPMSKIWSQFLLLLLAGWICSPVISIAEYNRKIQKGRVIHDITHKITPQLPKFDSKRGLGHFISPISSIKNGSDFNVARFRLQTHTGTHVDAPSHVSAKYQDDGYDVTTLNLYVLNGPALVVEVPKDKNITAEVLQAMNIPKDVHRVIFKTLNTDKKLMQKTEFDSSFTGFTKEGARWLVDHTNVKLAGIDYLSVSVVPDAVPTHQAFLHNMRVIPVEGLNLDGIAPGSYDLSCLPLRMAQADGSPSRCILIK